MEEWRDVKGYEGFYQVSSYGNVRNLAIYSHKYNRVIKRKTGRFLRPETTHDGYKRVVLSLYGNKKKFMVHRLVAFSFIPNPDGLPEVNHKDENQANNKVENLEWCTAKYNSNYGTLPKRISDRCRNDPRISKAVCQYNLDGSFVTAYPSLKEAARTLGTISSDMISRACKGKAKTAGGYKWSFA